MAGIKFLLAELRTYQPVIPPEVGDALRILFVKVESVLHKEPETIKHCRIKTNFFCGQKTNFFAANKKIVQIFYWDRQPPGSYPSSSPWKHCYAQQVD
jgi:hypothetical protein